MTHPLFKKTVADPDKFSFVAILLLLYFFIYAVSPLSLTYTVNKFSELQDASDSGTGINFLLAEIIWARIFGVQNINDSDSRVRIVIRKARAVLPEDVNSRVTSLGGLALLSRLISVSEKASASLIASVNGLHSIRDFNPLHCGPAPPVS